MGEIADEMLNRLFDRMFDDDWDADEYHIPASKPTCKFCGKTDLTWGHTYKGWKLFEGCDHPHICNRTSTDDFEDLTK